MGAPPTLEDICRPVFVAFCNYWQLKQIGTPAGVEKFRGDLQAALSEAKLQALADPALTREYEQIERPLAFFIDFMVHEGRFPFSAAWRELGRNFNELSGDEKFFNLLNEAMEDSRAENLIPLFYTMLGLGFEGAHINDSAAIAGIMRQCAARFPDELDLGAEPIVTVDTENRFAGEKKGGSLRPLRMTLLFSFLLLLVSLAVNFKVFYNSTLTFRETLTAAAAQAREVKTITSEAP
jgi:type VI protein secretion system component VasF